MQRSEFRLLDRVRVRWAEIDAQQIVFNGHYLTYFDTAMGAYWRALAMPYAQTLAALGGDLFVRKATLEYLAPARYDEVLDVGVRCARVGTSSMTFECGVLRQDACLVTGELVYVFADAHGRGARPVPVPLRDTLLAFEAGESMLNVQLGTWAELGVGARALRAEVFIQEQGVDAALEQDLADENCVHAVVRNRFGQLLATGRLQPLSPGTARIGRMAVTRALRGGGVGRLVLDALVSHARERGDRELVLHAQLAAVPFYLRAGFETVGSSYTEAGIEHIDMRRSL